MANGDKIDSGRVAADVYHASYRLLDAIAAVDDGVWVEVKGFPRGTVHVSGITTATVEIRGSNAVNKPANTAHEVQIGSNITTDSLVAIDSPVRWIKARISAHTTGTISANLHLVSL